MPALPRHVVEPQGLGTTIRLQAEDVITPILKRYQALRVDFQYGAMFLLTFIGFVEVYDQGKLTAGCFSCFIGILLCYGLTIFVKEQPANATFLVFYESAVLGANAVFESLACACFSRLLDSEFFGTCIAFGISMYVIPQLHSAWSVTVFFAWHIYASCIMLRWDKNLIISQFVVCLFLVLIWNAMRSLADAAQAIEREVIANRNELEKVLAARDQIQGQFRELLECAFHGIVQVVDGRVHWADKKFQSMFRSCREGNELRSAFAEADRAKIDELTRRTPGEARDRVRRLLVAQATDGWEFDCELMDATSQADSTIVIGVRMVGEMRQIQSEMRQIQALGKHDLEGGNSAVHFPFAVPEHQSAALDDPPHFDKSFFDSYSRGLTASSTSRELVPGSLSLTASVKSASSASQQSRKYKRLRKQSRTVSTQTEACTKPPFLPGNDTSQSAQREAAEALRIKKSARASHRKAWGQVSFSSNRLLLPEFKETPNSTIWLCILSMLAHLNVRGSGCCPWHVTLTRVRDSMKCLGKACQVDYMPNHDMQCASCLSMCEAEFDSDSDADCAECMVCGSFEMRRCFDVDEHESRSTCQPGQSSSCTDDTS